MFKKKAWTWELLGQKEKKQKIFCYIHLLDWEFAQFFKLLIESLTIINFCHLKQ